MNGTIKCMDLDVSNVNIINALEVIQNKLLGTVVQDGLHVEHQSGDSKNYIHSKGGDIAYLEIGGAPSTEANQAILNIGTDCSNSVSLEYNKTDSIFKLKKTDEGISTEVFRFTKNSSNVTFTGALADSNGGTLSTADKDKLAHISVTADVNLNMINTNTNSIDALPSPLVIGDDSDQAGRGSSVKSNTDFRNTNTNKLNTLPNSFLAIGDYSHQAGRGSSVKSNTDFRNTNTNKLNALPSSFLSLGTSSSTAAKGNLVLYKTGGTMTGDLYIDNTSGSPLTSYLAGAVPPEIKIERGTIHLAVEDGDTNQRKRGMKLHSAVGKLPGANNGDLFYPVIESEHTYLYFVTTASNGTRHYTGYIGNTGTSRMDFTACHRCVPENINLLENISNYIGNIVESTGFINSLVQDSSGIHQPTIGKNAIDINEACPIIRLTNSYKSKKVYGVISDGEDINNPIPDGNKIYNQGAFNTIMEANPNDNRLFINALGEGAIWVLNVRGNIENGDFICSSGVGQGWGVKQDDDLFHNYTVAKCVMNCDFDIESDLYECEEIIIAGETYKKAFLACVYRCG
jgi:hypothetical protein